MLALCPHFRYTKARHSIHKDGSAKVSTTLKQRGKSRTYWYRKRVPSDVAKAFGQVEVNRSLGTDVLSEARYKAARLEAELQATYRRLRGQESLTTETLRIDALKELKRWDLEPKPEPKLSDFISKVTFKKSQVEQGDPKKFGPWDDSAPIFEPDYDNIDSYFEGGTLAQMKAFLQSWQSWWLDRELTEDMVVESMDALVGPRRGRTLDSTEENALRRREAQLAALAGEAVEIKPTWRSAVEGYIRNYNSKRDTLKQVTRGYQSPEDQPFRDFAEFLGGDDPASGWEFLLEDVDARLGEDFRDWYRSKHPKNSNATWNKRMHILQAAYNHARRRHQILDKRPFERLSLPEGSAKKKRRGFTPVEWPVWQEAVAQHKNRQLSLITKIANYTGCRSGEARGLAVEDMALDREPPLVRFTENPYRRLKSENSERTLPLSKDIAEDLRNYINAEKLPAKGAPLFPMYNEPGKRGEDNLSQAQRTLLNKVIAKDPLLTPYSSRHTFASRARAAGMPTAISQAIVGHKDFDETIIHSGYGDGHPMKQLSIALEQINAVEDWGQFIDFDID